MLFKLLILLLLFKLLLFKLFIFKLLILLLLLLFKLLILLLLLFIFKLLLLLLFLLSKLLIISILLMFKLLIKLLLLLFKLLSFSNKIIRISSNILFISFLMLSFMSPSSILVFPSSIDTLVLLLVLLLLLLLIIDFRSFSIVVKCLIRSLQLAEVLKASKCFLKFCMKEIVIFFLNKTIKKIL